MSADELIRSFRAIFDRLAASNEEIRARLDVLEKRIAEEASATPAQSAERDAALKTLGIAHCYPRRLQ